jgi:hypothetical protein
VCVREREREGERERERERERILDASAFSSLLDMPGTRRSTLNNA